MRRTALFLLAGFALLSHFNTENARAADAVAVEPPVVTPGKPITLKWYFTGEKVLLSGGRFGKGVVVTGKTAITDTPRATTRYTFDVWYKIPAPKPVEPKPIDVKAVDPKASDVKAVDPKAIDAKAANPKTADGKASDPKPVDPKVSDPKIAAPKAAEPKVTDPKASDPKPVDSKAGDSKAAEPKATDPKGTIPLSAPPIPTDPKAAAPKPSDTKPADPATTPKPTDAKPTVPGTALKQADPKATQPDVAAAKQADPKAVDPKPTDPKPAVPKAPVAAAQEMVLQHVQYITYAEVWSGVYPPMKPYRDPHGWQVSFLSDWKRDNVPTAAEGSDGLVYFQQEDDSVERMAVAIMPVKAETAQDVLSRISEDVYGHYQNAKLTDPVDLTFNAVPAKMMTFTGLDLSHPGTQTASVVLLFVRNGRAYVLSARTGATHFNSRRPVLEKLLRSFAFNK